MKKSVPSQSQLLSASELARRAGVSVNTIRYYHLLGLLTSQKTPASGRRWFSANSLEQMSLIRQLNKAGYTLRAIREIFVHRWKK